MHNNINMLTIHYSSSPLAHVQYMLFNATAAKAGSGPGFNLMPMPCFFFVVVFLPWPAGFTNVDGMKDLRSSIIYNLAVIYIDIYYE